MALLSTQALAVGIQTSSSQAAAKCFGLYLGFRRGIWEVLSVLSCAVDYSVNLGVCFVYCGFKRVILAGIGVKE